MTAKVAMTRCGNPLRDESGLDRETRGAGFQAQKNHLSVASCSRCTNGAKAGLEHHNYPYDHKRLKIITLDMIPTLIPPVPIGDNRTDCISHFELVV